MAERCLATQRDGHDVVVVVSAMSGETNRLLGLAREIIEVPNARELDVLASTGEQVSAALLALAIEARGGRAQSLMGHQVRILTDGAFTKARIRSIDDRRVREALAEQAIAVVAGFQGVNESGDITTLGRGGSDTTAVAIAAALGADSCEIYTDVEGVFTTDPNICPSATKIDRISYDEMLELASLGAKVLQIRSVEIAMKYGVPIHVRSSFSSASGTIVTKEDKSLEEVVVSGVAYERNEARIHVMGVEDRPGVVATLFSAIAASNISVDMIIQTATAGEGAKADVTFTIGKTDLARARSLIESKAREIGAESVRYDEQVVKVSIVGLGMRSHAGVAAKMFQILGEAEINILAITTSEIKVSCLIAEPELERAVRALHDGFGLQNR